VGFLCPFLPWQAPATSHAWKPCKLVPPPNTWDELARKHLLRVLAELYSDPTPGRKLWLLHLPAALAVVYTAKHGFKWKVHQLFKQSDTCAYIKLEALDNLFQQQLTAESSYEAGMQ